MIRFAKISDSSKNPGRVYFDLSAIHPFDAMKVVLEQGMYFSYISHLCNKKSIADALQDRFAELMGGFSRNLPIGQAHLESHMRIGVEFIENIYKSGMINNKKFETSGMKLAANSDELLSIFNQPNVLEYNYGEYTCTMTESFFYEWESFILKRTELPAKLGTTQYSNCAIYLPSEHIFVNDIPTISKNQQIPEGTMIRLEPHPLVDFSVVFSESEDNTLISFLRRFDLRDKDINDLIGIMASFSLDRDHYAMTLSTGRVEKTVADVCHEMIVECSEATSADNTQIVDGREFVDFIVAMVRGKRLGMIDEGNSSDLRLFGDLVDRIGLDVNITNYFKKPIALISGDEALSFRRSVFATIMRDRFSICMEAGNDIGDTEDTDDAVPDTATIDDGTVDDLEDDEDSAEDKKPTIDPNQMLLEMSKKSDSLSDFLFRELIAKKISEKINNPPANASPNDILMLKRWRTRWLYIVSTACLRDFITRVSIRLSD